MDIEYIIKLFLESKKNSNVILELEASLLSDDESCVLSSISAVQSLFEQIFNQKMLTKADDLDNIQEKYRIWLLDRYNDFTTHLLNYLSHNNEEIQKAALNALIKFVQLETKEPLKIVPSGNWYFPKALFERIVNEMASHDIDQRYLITEFRRFTSFDDVKMYLLKFILHTFEKADKVTDVFLNNCFLLLCTLKMPSFSEQKEIPNTLGFQEGVETPFHLKKKLYIKLFSTVWMQFLHFQLPPLLINKVLIILHKKVIPYLQNPCLMTDFLTDSYNKGGITSLLALHGLFILMEKYNVEYPDFFFKLYALFDESIINGKFSTKFFYLSDIFLSSTHLPSYVVAAFVKKLCRISLNSKADSIVKIIPFVCNILIRHPTLIELINRKYPKELERDPYDFLAADPTESRAIESSLWEIKTLQSHVNPVIAHKAKLINSDLPKLEFDLSKLLTVSMSNLYENERKRKFTDAPLAISKACKDNDWWILSNNCIL